MSFVKASVRQTFASLCIGICVLVADQLTKHWATSTFAAQAKQYISIVDGWLSFSYTLNHGAAFGAFAGDDLLFVLTAVVIVCAILVSVIWFPARRALTLCSLGLQLGGAAGNLIDRVRLGYVVDFIYVRHFPVFNIADAAIVSGACLLAWVWLHPSGADVQQLEHSA
jgi:signal peptidase II